ncbi:MAG: KUP/HAK/KT family potassium transporter [Candidatus Dependentiae bacterium]
MKNIIKNVIRSLGIVFGDIGTSPIYTLSAVFMLIPISPDNVLGVLSLIVWTLILLVTVQYAWLAMSLGSKGEGGTIVLKELLIPLLKSRVAIAIATILSFLGISFFIGDGVITPAISILSAVEGLKIIPGVPNFPQEFFIITAAFIAICLFLFQKRGTEKIAVAFGPLMLGWFLFLGSLGIWLITQQPTILYALNPLRGIGFLVTHKFIGFLALAKIILCATGAEPLYADMGHLGRRPITQAWGLVFVCLVCAYLGQGVFILQNIHAKNIFYEMVLAQLPHLYVPIVLFSICATVIASQATISGISSIVYQGITTRIIPRFHIEYTSTTHRSQIYLPSVNWFLMTLVLITMLKFKYAVNLASAYGLAASGTMTITALLLTWVFMLKKYYVKGIAAAVVSLVNIAFLVSNTQKIPYGGYWSLLMASIPLVLIIIYTSGQRKLYASLKPLPLDEFLKEYNTFTPQLTHIGGTAVFLSRSKATVPTYMAYTMFTNTIIYQENIVVTVKTLDRAYGISGEFKPDWADRLRHFEISAGYKEIINIEKILSQAGISPKVIFYGMEDITAKNIIWKIFTIIKKLTPSFVQFYKLPSYKLHGVIVRVRM